MGEDYVAENLGWMDGLMIDPGNGALFRDEVKSAIQKEISERWTRENRLSLLEGLSARFPEEKVLEVVDTVISSNLKRDWALVAKENGNSLERLIELVWGPLEGNEFQFSSERQGNSIQFRVTRCAVCEAAKTMDPALNAHKWLYHLVCLTDGPSAQGFNPDIRFERTQTLMQGHPCCDHRYTDLSR
jgi:hypothetical protein